MASRSVVWKHFEALDDSKAKCKICKTVIKTSKNTSNLFSHVRNKHPLQNAALEKEKEEGPAVKKKKDGTQPTVASMYAATLPYDKSSAKKRKLDSSLVWMLATDMQPAQVVDDQGFRRFVKDLDPRYELPSRRTIMRDMLPSLYREEKDKLNTELSKTSFVSITTDIWTSSQTQAFLSVTAHYVTDAFELHSAVLRTVHMTTNHTGENIANELTKVIEEFSLREKLVAIVSDNASNMTAAVKHLGIRHLPCFAHTLNLIVRAALQESSGVMALIDKVKTVVEYFHRSVNASDRLRAVQQQQSLPETKLINDVHTRWNSTVLMLQRFIEQRDAVTSTLTQLGKGAMCLSDKEYDEMKPIITALIPFLKATEEMSAEKTTTLSKIVPLARSLLQKAKLSPLPLSKALEKHMLTRKFHLLETFSPLSQATLMDPRFKNIAFKDEANLANVQTSIQAEMTAIPQKEAANQQINQASPPSTSAANDDLWQDFDIDVQHSSDHRSLQTEKQVECRRYFEEQNIPRDSNPLYYWSSCEKSLPMLSSLARKFLCIPATSVPSERLFSAAGELVRLKRNRLKPKNIDVFLFLYNRTRRG